MSAVIPPPPAATGQLYRSLVESGQLVFLALRPDGTIAYASGAITEMLGRQPDEAVGSSVLDWLHPEDLERAIFQIASSTTAGVARGITRFRVAHADGSWVPVEIWAMPVSDGEQDLIGICARDGSHQVFLEDVMARLLVGGPRAEALAPVCNTIQWHGSGSHVAIGWTDGHGSHSVTTGVPPALAGAGAGAGAAAEPPEAGHDPWERSRSTTERVEGTADELPETLAAIANEHGVHSFWIEPVRWSDEYPPAAVTVWAAEGRSPAAHSYGMNVAKTLVELILRWTEQVQELDRAARFDPLTGLANRRAFFAALRQDGVEGGAVLYCDLDKFKPVNDELGHAAGDELLRLVARRLEASVRSTDLVARLGGDEFAVMCLGSSREEANEVAERIKASLTAPFHLAGAAVTVGISVGVGYDAGSLDESVLEEADKALGTDKADRRR